MRNCRNCVDWRDTRAGEPLGKVMREGAARISKLEIVLGDALDCLQAYVDACPQWAEDEDREAIENGRALLRASAR